MDKQIEKLTKKEAREVFNQEQYKQSLHFHVGIDYETYIEMNIIHFNGIDVIMDKKDLFEYIKNQSELSDKEKIVLSITMAENRFLRRTDPLSILSLMISQ